MTTTKFKDLSGWLKLFVVLGWISIVDWLLTIVAAFIGGFISGFNG